MSLDERLNKVEEMIPLLFRENKGLGNESGYNIEF